MNRPTICCRLKQIVGFAPNMNSIIMGKATKASAPTSERNRTLGEVIRDTRSAQGLSIRELAKRAEISSAFLSEIERGRRNPSNVVVKRLAQILEIQASILQGLNPVAALWEFKEIIEKDRELAIAFTSMVRALKAGTIGAKAVAKRIAC
jgi:transcriptional regulator with XRE-family HTH domain